MTAHTFWDREAADPILTSWMFDPLVRQYILTTISGTDELLWPVDWFARWIGKRHFARGLSIGCGTGPMERDLVRRNLVDRIDAFDGSANSLRVAVETARAEGMSSRIRYFAADFNQPALPHNVYDVVIIHQALHHVAKLEKLLRSVLGAMQPGGVLYLDEYIGPSRHDWTDELIAPHRRLYRTIPEAARRVDEVPFQIQVPDPSESIRSAEIIAELEKGFDVQAMRGYGGNVLSVLYPYIDFTKAPGAIERLIAEERRVLAAGERPYYAVIVATPKQNLRRRWASIRYFLEPKLKRIVREVYDPLRSR